MATMVRPLSTGILPALALETRVPLLKRRSAPHPAVPPSRPASTSMAALASSQSGLGQSLLRRLSRSPFATALTVRDFGFPPSDPRHFGRPRPSSAVPTPASPPTPLLSGDPSVEPISEHGTVSEDETGALHLALYDFAAEGSSEMDLVEGELVRVLEVICDGWVVARKVRGEIDEESGRFDEDMVWDGLTGLCPQNYLMKI